MKRFVIYSMLILGFVSLAFATHPNDKINPKSFDTKLFEKAIFYKVNEYRKSKGIRPLLNNSVIYKVAKDHNDFLKTNKELTHDQPTAEKATVQNRIEYYLKVKRYAAGENLARTFVLKPTYNYDDKGKTSLNTATTYAESAEYMFNAWKQSEFHNKNMLNSDYQISAIAAYFNPKDYSLTATQVFARID